MIAFSRRAMVLLAVTVACRTGLVLAGDCCPRLASSGHEPTVAAGDREAAAPSPCPVEDSNCAESRWSDMACEHCGCGAMLPQRPVWTIDYRVRSMFNSHTRYEFGTNAEIVPPYAPLSRLDWSLDSVWTGLRIGLEKPNWDVSFEWLTPMQRNIDGRMADFDWITPTDPSQLDILSYSPERWNDGQMLDLKGDFKLTDKFFALPIQVWPTAGFRFQRFDITGHDTVEVLPTPGVIPGDTLTFNQQYYITYVGGQLHTALEIARLRRTIDLTFQGDWGATWGYNVDHHISGYEPTTHRYTMESTSGGAVHLALIAETPLTKRFSIGLQADHLAIQSTGTHRLLVYGDKSEDETWSNGVAVKSDQTSITAFLRARF